MNVSLNFLWGFNLNDKVNIWDVKTPGCDVCSNENFEFSFLKSLHSNFALVLGYVAVHNFNVLLDFV